MDLKTERRRYVRHEIRLEAIMMIHDSVSEPCVIVDFCPGGLLLDMDQTKTESLPSQQQIVSIHFSASQGFSDIDHQITVQVLHIRANGIGVAFENISDATYQALLELASIDSDYSLSDLKVIAGQQQSLDNLISLLKENTHENLSVLLNEFFLKFAPILERESKNAKSIEDQTACTEVITNVQFEREKITNDFMLNVNNDIDHVNRPKSHKNIQELEERNLELIDKQEFEDWLNISSIIRRLDAQFEIPLISLSEKLNYATGIPITSINNPFCPANLCGNIRNAVMSLSENIAVKHGIYKVFETALTAKLDSLYEKIDTHLTEYTASIPRAKFYPDPKALQQREQKRESCDFFMDQQVEPMIHQYAEELPSASSEMPDTTGESTQNLTAESTTLHSTQSILRTTSHLIDLLKQTDLGDNWRDLKTDSTNPFNASSAEIGLDSLPNQSNLSELSLVNERLANFNIEVYERLFNTLTHEVPVSQTTQAYLQDIQKPLMDIAIKDPEFLNNDLHPARNVLNQIDSLQGLTDWRNNEIMQQVDQIIAKIKQDSTSNPDTFNEADQALRAISEPAIRSRNLNIERVIETYAGKQKIQLAKQAVEKEIDQRIAGKTVPKLFVSLLDVGWQQLLVLAKMDDDTNQWQSYITVLDQLLLWLPNQKLLSDHHNDNIHATLDFIDKNLPQVAINAYQHSQIIEQLNSALLGSGEPKIRIPIEKITVEKKPSESDENNDDGFDLADQINVGDWLTFTLENDVLEPLKSVWIGEAPRNFVFVNRMGFKTLELQRTEMTEQLLNGTATQIESLDTSLMERTTNFMMQKMQNKLRHTATHDPITLLINRKEFVRQLNLEISKQTKPNHLLCYIEILDLRIITNSCGINAGDKYLKALAELMKNKLPENSILAKLSDHSFSLLLKNCSANEALKVVTQLREQINEARFQWEEKSYAVGVSIGLTTFIDAANNIENIIKKADAACLSAKSEGNSYIQIYEEDDESLKSQFDMYEWAGKIDQILAEQRLYVRCQKIAPVDPEKNSHLHYEMLLGITDEEGEIIPPDLFIPAVERCQRMSEIDQWVVNSVFGWIAQHGDFFEKIDGFSINLSGQSLNSQKFLDFLKQRLNINDIPHHKITFEITETVAAGNMAFASKFITDIKQFGCKFSLDDFGTGYSSYAYLKRLNVDYLKIDGAFVKDIASSNIDVAMVKSMNEIGHSLGLETIAEYVENEQIQEILKDIGVDFAQGWGIEKPIKLLELAI